MAVSRNFFQFRKRAKVRAKQIEQGMQRTIKAAALAADTGVVLATPVDTGRARSNWFVSFGSPVNIVREGGEDTSGMMSIEEARQKISKWKIGSGSIFISNSLPYIGRLEDGSSAQAPTGMTQFGIKAAQSVLRSAQLLRE